MTEFLTAAVAGLLLLASTDHVPNTEEHGSAAFAVAGMDDVEEVSANLPGIPIRDKGPATRYPWGSD